MSRRALSVVADRPTVAMCAGKDCRKRSESVKMRESLDGACDLLDLKCIGVCSGPVVVVDPAGAEPVVYSRLRSKRQRSLLSKAIVGDKRAIKELVGRRVFKKKALARATRQLERWSPSRRAA